MTDPDEERWTYEVRVHAIRKYVGQKRTSYAARWRVGNRRLEKGFATAKLADGFRSKLRSAASAGEEFSLESGLPRSMVPRAAPTTWHDHTREYVSVRWPHISPAHRRSIAETLTGVATTLAPEKNGRPTLALMRRVLYKYAYNASTSEQPTAPLEASALTWIAAHSPLLSDVAKPERMRVVLDALTVNLDGSSAAVSTVTRKRAVLHNCLQYGVERQRFATNPLHALPKRRLPPAPAVDRRVVVNPDQARTLIRAVHGVAPELRAFFAVMYFAGLRPAEVRNLRDADLTLPRRGWGQLLLSSSFQSPGPGWTDDGAPGEERGLKHRALGDTRPVPAHPELVEILRQHIGHYTLGPDGRLFVNRTGRAGVPLDPPYPNPVSMSTVYRVWHRSRTAAFNAAQLRSPLARRPYDLRHACLSTWLNAGVPPAQVAAWAGHTVDVLLRIYSKCIDGQEQLARRRIEEALDRTTIVRRDD